MGTTTRFERIFETVIDAIENLNSANGSSFHDIVSCIKRRITDSGRKPKPNFTFVIRTALQRAVVENLLDYSRGRYKIPYESANQLENDDIPSTGLSSPMDDDEDFFMPRRKKRIGIVPSELRRRRRRGRSRRGKKRRGSRRRGSRRGKRSRRRRRH